MASDSTQGSYSMGAEDTFTKVLQRRRVLDNGFFTKHLKTGMLLLDVGCGPGPVTLELAELVKPGEVVGVDSDPAMIDRAKALASENNVLNVTFEVGDANKLPFPSASFDVVYAQLVIMHLRDAVGALREMRRVLRSGGLAGIVDADVGTRIVEPMPEGWDQFLEMEARVSALNGRDLYFGRKQRRALLDAGFSRAEQTATITGHGSPEAILAQAPQYEGVVRALGRTALDQGWIEQGWLDSFVGSIHAWAQRPDAFISGGQFLAIGFVDN